MNLTEVLKALYASEINCGLQACWDGGWIAWIGDDRDSAETIEFGIALQEVAAWLDSEARRLYPNSEYAKQPPPLF